MNAAFKEIFRDKIIFWSFLISFLLLLTMVMYVVIIYPKLPPFLPLYNRLPWGYSRLGGKLELFIPFGIGVFFLILNLFIASTVYSKIVLLARMISAVSFTLVLCTCIYLFNIIQLVL